MGRVVIEKIADNVVSPLGYTTADNLRAVLAGESRLEAREGAFGLPEPFCGSLLDREGLGIVMDEELRGGEGLTFFERLCALSAQRALRECDLSPSGADVLFVLSTTKGNVSYLEEALSDERCYLGGSAERIARYFGNPNLPLVVSNACISGVCAQIAGVRALLSGRYRYAVVVGCDVLSRFVVSGFQSFKALSPEPCKPYDKDRVGLNLGEAAGTMILKAVEPSEAGEGWKYVAGSIHNDANHISGPSRTGEGSFRVLRDILQRVDPEEIALVNVHGTSTAYNDEMESIALDRAGLGKTPINALKGYYGHTLGAAGLVETILSMASVGEGLVLGTRGFETLGTSRPVNISKDTRRTSGRTLVKMLSGFGGTNAGIAYRKGGKG